MVAYVACADRKVYALDLETGAVLAVSDPIEGIGRPTSIALDRETSRLYVGSERDRGQNDFYPLVALDTDKPFEIVGRYTLDPNRGSIDESVLNPNSYALYQVVFSAATRRLYFGYTAPGHGLSTVFDIGSGQIVGESEVGISEKSTFSPDGSKIAEIFPSGSRTRNGETTTWAGGVVVKDIATGEAVSRTALANNRGLQPPWKKLSSPFVYLSRPDDTLQVYERDSGRLLASIDADQATGLLPTGGEPVFVDELNEVVLPMMGAGSESDMKGFLVLISPTSGDILKTIEVGPRPTNVVVR
ncbi:MAG TPA: hypothetical protein VFV10_16905 [Gammaproteobacteria bacterium]|nr:hypothetical protein [Gammaproteobacteria bacterium]